VGAVVEVDEVGEVVDLDHSMGVSVRQLARTGSRVGLWLKICEWQFMHVFVGGCRVCRLVDRVWQ